MCNFFRLYISILILKTKLDMILAIYIFLDVKVILKKKKFGNLDYCRNNWINDVIFEIVFFFNIEN